MVSLRDIDRDNWAAVAELELRADQTTFVASNVKTIAESRFEPHYHLRAIYHNDTPVGLVAYCHEDDPVDKTLFWVFRLMIDRRFQRHGYGLTAMQLAIDEIWMLGATRIRTMHHPTNTGAATLYAKLGFEPTNAPRDDGDIELELRRSRSV